MILGLTLLAHEPFASLHSDAILCDTSMRAAHRTVTRAMTAASLSDIATVSEAPYALQLPDARGIDAKHACVMRAFLAAGDRRRAVRVELLPLTGRHCVAVKLWEDCSPDTAPEGDPRAWHWCGDPASLRFLHAQQSVRTSLGSSSSVEAD